MARIIPLLLLITLSLCVTTQSRSQLGRWTNRRLVIKPKPKGDASSTTKVNLNDDELQNTALPSQSNGTPDSDKSIEQLENWKLMNSAYDNTIRHDPFYRRNEITY
ncbi:uncharacterized protein LOC116296701 [Actinia tenebrosa]|uniref:Uncharacterized protein LOC116296701 n=1 Tax=Actinia tenebrosa TaxID=6105 RepID=A0A6P8I7F8_ACTTE|nr:uncharacterized protein LOC116296701 [Actinia tenebrosa]